jgi:DNA repair exonuclease SbcCD ATPase subunit
MIIRQLLLRNFMGYRRECGLDFRGKQTIGIVGNNESGKSTILSAICYLLYGDVPILTSETREVNLITDSADADMVVEGEVELPTGDVLAITRGRTKANTPIVKLAGCAGKASEVGAVIATKLGVSFQDFVALSYFVQGDIHQFMDGSKRDYFQRWAARLRQWEQYERAARSRSNDAVAVVTKLRAERERVAEEAEGRDDAKRELEQARAAQAQADKTQRLLEQQVDALAESVALREKQEFAERAAEAAAVQVRAQAAGLLHAAERRERTARAALRELSESKCPVLKTRCDRLLGGSEAAAARLAAARAELTESEAELAAAKKGAAGAAPSVPSKAQPCRSDEEKATLRAARSELAAHASARSRAAVAVGRAKERLDRAAAARARVQAIDAEVRQLDEDRQRLHFVEFMCGRSGIPLEVMDDELAAVEERCNWVLDRLDYPKRIRFAAYRELAGFEKVCPHCGGESWLKDACAGCGGPRPRKRRDEPTVTVLDGGTERPFSLESGGARVLQSFAVRLACSLFVASMTGSRVQMVMLDEVFAMLDAGNRQKLMALVVGKLSSEFGLKQQFVVSHQDDVVNAVDDILVVQKRGGSSVARWA